ncbi:MAG TPA: GSCFA domain-containing protein [Gammaproteobacteria bacterium]|nr:GSCFA domain-containing protein [Gammaproteobacteria bacterium]
MGFIDKALERRPGLKSALLRRGARLLGATAVKNFAQEHSRWYKAGIDAHDASGPYACQRLRRSLFVPAVEPRFRISKADRMFAVGSCFARGIEQVLQKSGFQMESAARDFDRFEVADDRKLAPLTFTNKYTTYSILNELTWALQPGAMFPEASLVDLDAGRCIDPHVSPALKLVGREGTLERRRIITDVTRRIKDCRVLFLTLGLVETWYDARAEVHLNATPIKEMHDLHPKRYEFVRSSYLQNMDNMEKLHELLTAHAHPDLHIIVTTSPVPMVATYTGKDVVVANNYSKATLCAVAQDWAEAHDNTQYFPSYEIVMNSGRDIAWEEDMRHVTGGMTRHVMDAFMEAFVEK